MSEAQLDTARFGGSRWESTGIHWKGSRGEGPPQEMGFQRLPLVVGLTAPRDLGTIREHGPRADHASAAPPLPRNAPAAYPTPHGRCPGAGTDGSCAKGKLRAGDGQSQAASGDGDRE